MAVHIELQNNQFWPVLRCDHCVQVIERGQGTALLAIRADGRPLTGEIICLHRVCTVRYQAAHQGRYQDLEEHLTTRPAEANAPRAEGHVLSLPGMSSHEIPTFPSTANRR